MIFSLSGLIDQEITIGTATIAVDGITVVSPTNSRTVTSHPVEDGFNISDAQHQLPIQVSFKAWITDNPQSALDGERVLASLANSTGINLVEGNVKKQLQKLETEANKGSLVTVKTKFAKYTNYYCVSFNYQETTKKGIEINISIMEKQDSSDDERGTANFSPDIGLWS
jgi:hypothetical protein